MRACTPACCARCWRSTPDVRGRFVGRIEKLLDGLDGKTLAIWGLAFKEDTDDLRESPALDIIAMAQERGAAVRAYDPAAMANAARRFPQVTMCASPYDAATGADAVVVVTPWREFRQVDLGRVAKAMRGDLLLDGRNLYESGGGLRGWPALRGYRPGQPAAGGAAVGADRDGHDLRCDDPGLGGLAVPRSRRPASGLRRPELGTTTPRCRPVPPCHPELVEGSRRARGNDGAASSEKTGPCSRRPGLPLDNLPFEIPRQARDDTVGEGGFEASWFRAPHAERRTPSAERRTPNC